MDSKKLSSLAGRLEAAQGLIFDLRGYPSGEAFTLIRHLANRPIVSPFIYERVGMGPDGGKESWIDNGWTLKPERPKWNGRAVFLVDGRSISACETIASIVKDNHLGTLVGEDTAGTNGEMFEFCLFDLYDVSWTGMRVLDRNRVPNHGRGVVVDVKALPTVEGLKAGRDDGLEAAIRVLTK